MADAVGILADATNVAEADWAAVGLRVAMAMGAVVIIGLCSLRFTPHIPDPALEDVFTTDPLPEAKFTTKIIHPTTTVSQTATETVSHTITETLTTTSAVPQDAAELAGELIIELRKQMASQLLTFWRNHRLPITVISICFVCLVGTLLYKIFQVLHKRSDPHNSPDLEHSKSITPVITLATTKDIPATASTSNIGTPSSEPCPTCGRSASSNATAKIPVKISTFDTLPNYYDETLQNSNTSPNDYSLCSPPIASTSSSRNKMLHSIEFASISGNTTTDMDGHSEEEQRMKEGYGDVGASFTDESEYSHIEPARTRDFNNREHEDEGPDRVNLSGGSKWQLDSEEKDDCNIVDDDLFGDERPLEDVLFDKAAPHSSTKSIDTGASRGTENQIKYEQRVNNEQKDDDKNIVGDDHFGVQSTEPPNDGKSRQQSNPSQKPVLWETSTIENSVSAPAPIRLRPAESLATGLPPSTELSSTKELPPTVEQLEPSEDLKNVGNMINFLFSAEGTGPDKKKALLRELDTYKRFLERSFMEKFTQELGELQAHITVWQKLNEIGHWIDKDINYREKIGKNLLQRTRIKLKEHFRSFQAPFNRAELSAYRKFALPTLFELNLIPRMSKQSKQLSEGLDELEKLIPVRSTREFAEAIKKHMAELDLANKAAANTEVPSLSLDEQSGNADASKTSGEFDHALAGDDSGGHDEEASTNLQAVGRFAQDSSPAPEVSVSTHNDQPVKEKVSNEGTETQDSVDDNGFNDMFVDDDGLNTATAVLGEQQLGSKESRQGSYNDCTRNQAETTGEEATEAFQTTQVADNSDAEEDNCENTLAKRSINPEDAPSAPTAPLSVFRFIKNKN